MKKYEIARLGFPENLGTALRNDTLYPEQIKLPSSGKKAREIMKEYLPDRTYEIMVDRYVSFMGILEIGKKHGLSYERVRQIVDKAERTLRAVFFYDLIKNYKYDIHYMPLNLYFCKIKEPSRSLRIVISALSRAWYPYTLETVGDLIKVIHSGEITKFKGVAEKSKCIIVEQLIKDGVDPHELEES